MVFRPPPWRRLRPWVFSGKSPVLTQVAFRGRNVDGSETTATWKAAQNTDWAQPLDTAFRVRFETQESAGVAWGGGTGVGLQFRRNGGTWTGIYGASAEVRTTADAGVPAFATTTDQLTAGTGTFESGEFDDDNGYIGGGAWTIPASGHTEHEWCLILRSADGVTNGDTIELRVIHSNGAEPLGATDWSPLNAYAAIPLITVGTGGLTVSPALISQPAAVIGPRIDQSLAPGLISQPVSAPAPSISPLVNPALISQPAATIAPRIDQQVAPGLQTRAASAVAPRIDLQVAPGLIAQPAAAIAPTRLDLQTRPTLLSQPASPISPGSVNQAVSAGLITSSAVAIALARVDQQVLPVLLAQPATPVTPTILTGLSVAPAQIQALATPITFLRIDQTAAMSLLSQPVSPLGPGILPWQTVAAALISSAAVAVAPSIFSGQTVQVQLITQTATLLIPDILSGIAWGGQPIPAGWAVHATPDGSAALLVPVGEVQPGRPVGGGYNLKPRVTDG